MGVRATAADSALSIFPAVVVVHAPLGIKTSIWAPLTGGVILTIAATPETIVMNVVGAINAADAIVLTPTCAIFCTVDKS